MEYAMFFQILFLPSGDTPAIYGWGEDGMTMRQSSSHLQPPQLQVENPHESYLVGGIPTPLKKI